MHGFFREQEQCEWNKPPRDTGVVALQEATALIVGVGGIGAEAARLASAFGCDNQKPSRRNRETEVGQSPPHQTRAKWQPALPYRRRQIPVGWYRDDRAHGMWG